MSAVAAAPVELGSRRELFVDRLLIEQLEGTSLRLHEPVPGGVAVQIDQPWEGPANGPLAVLRHGDQFLLYYRAMTVGQDDVSGRTCVAVSRDGMRWAKPKLGLVSYRGRTDTNIVVDETGKELSVVPWLDTRPGIPSDERIKAFHSEAVGAEKHTAYHDPKGPKRLVMFGSGDGFRFRRLTPQPQIVSALKNSFDGGNAMFWSDAEQQYVLYFRIWDGGRSVGRMTSKDFLRWTEPVAMQFGATPREQFYTNQTEPYFRAPHLYVAPAARFMERRRVITEAQAQDIGLRQVQGHSYHNDCADAVLLTSRAGSEHYDRTFMEAFVRPGPGASNWVSRTNYPLTGILPAGTDRMMLFVARHYMQDSWHIERLTLRTDGFASVHAPWAGGRMLTKPLRFSGERLFLNYRTSAAGSLRVEIQSAEGKPIPGFGAADGIEMIGDEIEREVLWRRGADVSCLAGQSVRLLFIMKDADLYALRFGPDPKHAR
ncbi:MAG: hypothetical protein JNL92_01675 [Opitutaceae bacterium]|nr:hypothetical protein [Opitutaceae bacterium]